MLLPLGFMAITLCSFNRLNKKIEENTVFKEIEIGKQVWMAQNLNIDTFNNGDSIPKAKTDVEWLLASQKKQAAWCYTEYDTTNKTVYGKLYNWYAVTDPRGFAPQGWHVPSIDEWKQLIDILGIDAGIKMKWGSGWYNNRNGTNLSGFSALPAGYIDDINGLAMLNGMSAIWWSSTEIDTNSASSISLLYINQIPIDDNLGKGFGLSVRCIKN